MVKLKRGQLSAIGFLIMMVVVVVLGLFTITYTANITESIDREDRESQSSFTSTSLNNTLSPVEEGITSNSIQTYNQTWLNFDGVNDYVNFSNYINGVNLTSNYSIYMRFIQNQPRTGNIVFQHSSNTNDRVSIQLGGTAIFGEYNGTVYNGKSGTLTYSIAGEWLNLIGVHNSENSNRLFLEGTELTGTASPSASASQFLIGKRSDGFPFNGSIDKILIFNKILNNTDALLIQQGFLVSLNNEVSNVEDFNYQNITPTALISNESETERLREIGNIINISGELRMVYTQYNGSYSENNTCTGWANSSDGVTWSKQGKLINCGGLPTDAHNATEDPYLIYNGSMYFLFAENKEPYPFANITLFTSTDFTNWEDRGDILSNNISNPYEGVDVSSPSVFREGNNWYMLYEMRNGTAQQGMIGLATSSDGITWTKHPDNPFIVPEDNMWDASSNSPDDVIKYGDYYYLMYHAYRTSWKQGLIRFTNFTNKSTYERYLDYPISDTGGSSMFFGNESNKLINDVSGTSINLSIMGNLTKTYGEFNFSDGVIFELKLQENNGTIAYDSSGNNNHGTISGATWDNDGILVSLVNGVDYTLNTATGLLTLSSDYLYSWVVTEWDYVYDNNTRDNTILHLIEFGVALGIIVLFVLFIRSRLE